jgi:pimeloyl-ACP methyl ester carboxylesterase
MIRSIKATALIMMSIFSLSSFADAKSYYFNRYQIKQFKPLPQSIQKKTFNQLVDHRNPNKGSFNQRYFIDESLAKSPTSPIFFYVCGESTCHGSSLMGAVRFYARLFNARLISLEHRYYGKSTPTSDFSTKNLRYLSTEQALDDLALFQTTITKEPNWQGKWVVFGGSYPGNLSAYYRLKNPHLVVGAVASSAPVQAKEDFYEFDKHIASVINKTCLMTIQQVVAEVESSINFPKKLDGYKKLFDAQDIKDSSDFLYLLADITAMAVQYGMKVDFCSRLEKSDKPLDAYALFAKELAKRFAMKPVEITPQGGESTKIEDYLQGFGMRQWLYQSCTEYGYWQNANPTRSESARSQYINLSYHHNICKRLFSINNSTNGQAINQQYYYSLLDSSAEKILFTNGDDDPWSNLSISEQTGNATNLNLSYFTIKGSAHCEDLKGPKEYDSKSLIEARQKTITLLSRWLGYNNV